MLPNRRIPLTLLLAALAVAWGCDDQKTYRSTEAPYRTVSVDPGRDTATAERLNAQGLKHLADDDIEHAEQAFARALTADVEYGPAHNNLGKVFYQKRDWYRAAWEFEYAKKLLPQHPEPRNNLGLVLENAGEYDRAIEQYRESVALAPENMEYTANLARAMIRRGDRTKEVHDLLSQILAKDTRPAWLIWAQQQQLAMDAAPPIMAPYGSDTYE